MNQHRKDLYLYGINSLLIRLRHAENEEDYEECKAIKEAIEEHNKLVNDNKPTRFQTANH